MEDSPGFKAGLLPGDKIVKIDGESTEKMDLNDAVNKLRGEPGSFVFGDLQQVLRKLGELLRTLDDLARKPVVFIAYGQQSAADGEFAAVDDNLTKAVELYEKTHIERILGKTGGDKMRAAQLLGLSLSTLYRKIEKLGLET